MNLRPDVNLSDEALCEFLTQPADAEHQGEALELMGALRSYRIETLAWAERRSATQPSLVEKAKASYWTALPQWSLAAVAVIAVAAGVVHFAGYGADDVARATGMPVATSGSNTVQPEDIAADNRLLGSIDKALRFDSLSTAAEFQTEPLKRAQHSTHFEITD